MPRTRRAPLPTPPKKGRTEHSAEDDLFKRQVGTRLREIRNYWKYTQAEFAALLGISISTYNKYEIGESFLPPRLLNHLVLWGVDMNYLLAGFGEKFCKGHVARPAQVERRIN